MEGMTRKIANIKIYVYVCSSTFLRIGSKQTKNLFICPKKAL